jgi:cysteine desulfurase/selenocysteine lyase
MKPRKDFPIFHHRPELIYLDNAATTQKPKVVLDAIQGYYESYNSNIHRSSHYLAEEATQAYESGRKGVAGFINAERPHQIIFTRNATEAINLVARSYGETFLKKGDRILLSTLEHHSNIVPWLQLKAKKGMEIDFLEIDGEGRLLFDETKITPQTKLISITAMSNTLGTKTDLKPIIQRAHEIGALVLIDACQLAAHEAIDVRALDADFMVFSAHKMYGPTGIGVLYGKTELLKKMPPFLGGGEMIQEVFKDYYTPGDLPARFEAGTPNIAGVIGLRAAIDYIRSVGFEAIQNNEKQLAEYTLQKLKRLPFLTMIGSQTMESRGPIFSFTLDRVHPHDIAEGLSQNHICIRAGHHCAQPLMDDLKLPATARISLSFYNTMEEIDRLTETLEEVYHYFSD